MQKNPWRMGLLKRFYNSWRASCFFVKICLWTLAAFYVKLGRLRITDMYPIIMAGGQGTRLWPVSRKAAPKQVRPFLDGETLLRKTCSRLLRGVPAENIYLTTAKALFNEIKKEAPDLPEKNIILEPARRDTAAALGLALWKVYKRDAEGIFVYVNADNFVKDEAEYLRILKLGEKIIEQYPKKTLLVGIAPLYPETGYGYIKAGEQFDSFDGDILYNVDEFIEKPDLENAKAFLARGNYFWNPTLIIGRVDNFLGLFEKHLPEMHQKLKEIAKYFDTPKEEWVAERVFPEISPVSIDYGILEKEQGMLVLPANFGWTDIGHWRAIWEISAKGEADNIALSRHVHIGSAGNLIYSSGKKLVATVGLKDMIIVETDDALLICPKEGAQEVKKIVQKLEEDGLSEYL